MKKSELHFYEIETSSPPKHGWYICIWGGRPVPCYYDGLDFEDADGFSPAPISHWADISEIYLIDD